LPSGGYLQANLVSDLPGLAQFTDPQLRNPWGIAFQPGGSIWIADNGTGLSTFFASSRPSGPVNIPIPSGIAGAWGTIAAPTGTLFNETSGFSVSKDGRSGRSLFLFTTENGTIAGFNPYVDPAHAVVAVDNSTADPGAAYLGLAMGSNASGTFLFAANFLAGTIDVFDQSFHGVHLPGSFTDPNLPVGYAPFNVQNIGNKLFVTYAARSASGDEVYGPGNGFLDVFDTNGQMLQRLVSQGSLNAPWGLAVAPPDFGEFSNDLLVGNVGDGQINAFDPATGAWRGVLQDAAGQAIVLPQVWGLTFGGNGGAGNPDTLFFTAGLANETHGLFGSLVPLGAGGEGDENYTSGNGNSPLTSLNSPGEDDYPLMPTAGPAFRGGVEERSGELSVILPLSALPQVLTPGPAFSSGNLPVSAGLPSVSNAPADPVQPVVFRGQNPGGAAMAFYSGAGQEMASPPTQLQALDMLLALSARTSSAGQPRSVGWRQDVFDAASRARDGMTSTSSIGPNLHEQGFDNDTPIRAAASGGNLVWPAQPKTPARNSGRLWTGLPLALGMYLAWFYRLAVKREPPAEERQPRLMHSQSHIFS